MEASAAEAQVVCDDSDNAVPLEPKRCANINCRASTASKWRGPHKEFCSKYACKKLAATATEVLQQANKDRRIIELEIEVLELRRLLAAARKEVVAASGAGSKRLAPAPPALPAPKKPAPSATEAPRPPLAPLAANAQQAAPSLTMREPAGKPPPQPPWYEREGGLPRGWISRPSLSRPGKLTYVFPEFGVFMQMAPRVKSEDGELAVQQALLKELMLRYKNEHDMPIKRPELWRRIEKCLQMKVGFIVGSKFWRRHVNRVTAAAAEQLAGEQLDAECEDEEGEEDEEEEEEDPDDEDAQHCEQAVCEAIREASAPEVREARLEVRNLHPDRVDFASMAAQHGMRA